MTESQGKMPFRRAVCKLWGARNGILSAHAKGKSKLSKPVLKPLSLGIGVKRMDCAISDAVDARVSFPV